MASLFAANEPSDWWKVSLSRPAARSASGVSRSCAKKNAASASRAPHTHSLPWRDEPLGVVGAIADRDEVRRHAAVLDQHQRLLVVAQRRDQHLLGQIEETRVDRPADRAGVLDELDQLGQQRRVGTYIASDLPRECRDELLEARATLVGVEEHAGTRERDPVGVEAGRAARGRSRRARSRGGRSWRTRRRRRTASTGTTVVQALGAEQRDDAVHRPDELHLPRPPAHPLREVEGGDDAGDDLGRAGRAWAVRRSGAWRRSPRPWCP